MRLRLGFAITQAYQALRWLMTRIVRAARYVRSLLWRMVRGPSEGWTTFLLLLISVMAVVWALEASHSVPAPGLYSIALWSSLLGLILAKIPFRGWLLVTVGAVVGLYLGFYYLTGLAEGAAALDRHAEIATRLNAWWQAVVSGDPADDGLPLSFSLLLASWSVGFLSSWSLFRKHNIWGALLPGGIIAVASLAIMLPDRQEIHLYLYLLTAFLLAARLFALQRHQEWDRRSIQYPPRQSRLRAPDGLWFAVSLVLVVSLLPVNPASVDPIAAAWNTVTRPAQVMGFELYRTLGGVPTPRPQQTHSFDAARTLGGAIALRDAPALIVRTPVAIYLSARSYDVYTHRGWESSATLTVTPSWTPEYGAATTFLHTREFDIEVKTMLPLRAGEPIFLGGYPVHISIDHQIEVLHRAVYNLRIQRDQTNVAENADYPPRDIRQAQLRLSELILASDRAITESDIGSVLPDDTRLVSWKHTGENAIEVTVERHVPPPLDTVSVRTAVPMSREDSYQTTVLVSTATGGDLLAAGTDYPGWVLDSYLQLPDDVPTRVTALAQELAGSADTPYEKAVAIRDYLRTLDYALDIQAPPRGADGVDYFLFDLQQGYCSYFASAMTVMLRASGVPSRFVTGYVTEEMVEEETIEHVSPQWQAEPRTFLARNSHAWCEVFFPGYGWIPFEPTPGYEMVSRNDFARIPTDDQHAYDEIGPRRPDDFGIIPGEPGDSPPREAGYPDSSSGGTQPGQRAGLPYVLPVVIAAGIAALGIVLWLMRRRLVKEVTEPRLAYARTGYLAALCGLGPKENFTPYEYGRKLATALPDVSVSLDRIVDAYVRDRYGRRRTTDLDRIQIAEAWPQVRNHLLRRALRGLLPGNLR